MLHLYWLGYILLTSATIPLMDTVVLMGDTATVDVSISVAVFFGYELLNLIRDLNWTWCEHISVFVYNNVTEKKFNIHKTTLICIDLACIEYYFAIFIKNILRFWNEIANLHSWSRRLSEREQLQNLHVIHICRKDICFICQQNCCLKFAIFILADMTFVYSVAVQNRLTSLINFQLLHILQINFHLKVKIKLQCTRMIFISIDMYYVFIYNKQLQN